MDNLLVVTSYLTHASYLGIFFALAIAGYIVPLPEEAVLLLIGYLAASGFFNIKGAIIVGFLAILVGDCTVFILSRHGSPFVHRLINSVNKNLLEKCVDFMERHAWWTIFLLKFAVGLRFIGIILAGSLKVRPAVFFLAEVAALSIYVPLFMTAGYHFHDKFTALLTEVASIRHAISWLILGAGSVLIGVAIHRHFLHGISNQDEDELAEIEKRSK